MSKLAVVLVRGFVNMSSDVRRTLDLLRLKRKFACVVVDDNEMYRGMLKKVKDYVTYGKITKDTFLKLLETRGKVVGDKPIDKKMAKEVAEKYFNNKIKLRDFVDYNLKPFFRLHPPRKGFERGGIKKPYQKGGALGYRGEAMNDLILRML